MLHLGKYAAELIAATEDNFIIGVIDWTDRTIFLFEAAPETDLSKKRFRGHRDLVFFRVIEGEHCVGFSLVVSGRHAKRFYRQSLLNKDYADFALPTDIMKDVLAAVGLPLAHDFRSYP